MVKINNLGKRFGNKWAVRGLSLDIPEGEIFGLLGPNAAGKTTAIKMITGIIEPTEGTLSVSGFDIVRQSMEAKSVIGYVPDRPFFYEKLTALEFLVFMSSIHKIEKGAALKKIDESIELYGLGDFKNEIIEGFSQGMKQRLIFASATLHKPRVLLIDEPFVGLDPFGVILIKDMIRSMSSIGVTVLLATHSLHIAGELCQRIGIINKGALSALRTKEDISNSEGGLEGLFIRHVGRPEAL